MPAVNVFERALKLGMGWGMMPDLLLAALGARVPVSPAPDASRQAGRAGAAFAALRLRNGATGVKPWFG